MALAATPMDRRFQHPLEGPFEGGAPAALRQQGQAEAGFEHLIFDGRGQRGCVARLFAVPGNGGRGRTSRIQRHSTG